MALRATIGDENLVETGGVGLPAYTSERSSPWSFYIFSGGGTADELFFRDFNFEFFQEFGMFSHFLT